MRPPSFRIAVFLGTLLCPKLGRIYNGIETFSEKTLQSEKLALKKNKLTVILQASRKMIAKSVDNQPASLIMRVMMRGFRHEEVCVCC